MGCLVAEAPLDVYICAASVHLGIALYYGEAMKSAIQVSSVKVFSSGQSVYCLRGNRSGERVPDRTKGSTSYADLDRHVCILAMHPCN